ncbi:MAG: deoxyribonuclease IV [Candidatus Fimisoma sp.]|nr:deoxyribonuclease IV [Bacillota bacterium]MDD7284944.1 deoxyribonuclease IV [Bacillota bacterium]MDY4747699.1 deoxyribonuclease IV [Candidatus Fimisoma sp.]
MVYLGCHLTSAKGYEHMAKDAISIGADTLQFFTRNPRGGAAKDIDAADVDRFLKLSAQHDFGRIVAHAPYTLNPCSKEAKTREFAHMVMTDDLQRMEYVPGNYYNFHPGSHVGQGTETGIRMIADMLNDIMKSEQTTTVLLETMAGKGSEIGGRFEELRAIIDRVNLKDKIGVCLDTCHVHDAGYDIVNNLDGVLSEFDRVIGLSRLKALHINDSKNPMGAHKDRHACIGEGFLGKEAFIKVITHPLLQGLPCILETPQESLQGYGEEIKMLREMI